MLRITCVQLIELHSRNPLTYEKTVPDPHISLRCLLSGPHVSGPPCLIVLADCKCLMGSLGPRFLFP